MIFLTAGESHGKKYLGIIEGFPAGVKVIPEYLGAQLNRRRLAPGRGPRQGKAEDRFEIISGLDGGNFTTGAPIGIELFNSASAPEISGIIRPGHADLAACLKYGLASPEIPRERASARETAIRTLLYSFCRRLLEELGLEIKSRVINLGGKTVKDFPMAEQLIKKAAGKGETLGGVVELLIRGVPAGLGAHTQPEKRLGARLCSALSSLNAVKGVETGEGFLFAALGKPADALFPSGKGFARKTNFAGGLEGGISNGEEIFLRFAVKGVSGTASPTPSLNYRTGKKADSFSLTSDVTPVFAAAVIGEFYAAAALAEAILEKFGGDSLTEIAARVSAWRKKTAEAVGRKK